MLKACIMEWGDSDAVYRWQKCERGSMRALEVQCVRAVTSQTTFKFAPRERRPSRLVSTGQCIVMRLNQGLNTRLTSMSCHDVVREGLPVKCPLEILVDNGNHSNNVKT